MLKQIKYFQSVVRRGSFTEAAEECFISQSAISQQIKALENELGVKLLQRDGRKFSLTPAREHFYKKSLILTADFDKLCRDTVRIAKGDSAQLRIGYLKCYGGQEFHRAVAVFSEKHPEVSIDIIHGNHEDLYDRLRSGSVDIVLNDQRRAFSDEYVNFPLVTSSCGIEISERNPIARLEYINISDLKNMSCILVASQSQQDNEVTYYRDVVGFCGEFLFAESLEEARLMAVGGKGFIPIDSGEKSTRLCPNIHRVLLYRSGKPIKRNYCAFWKANNTGHYIGEFADILKAQFSE